MNKPQLLAPKVLRRMERLHARAEGAQAVAQAAEAAFRALTEQYAAALRAACEDADIALPPPDAPINVSIDWATGAVTAVRVEQMTNGAA
jgi:hypothetical protein